MKTENFEDVQACKLASGEVILLGARQVMIHKIRAVKGMIEIRNSDGARYLFRVSAPVPRLKSLHGS